MLGTDIVARFGLPLAEDIERWTLGAILASETPSEAFQLVVGVLDRDDFGIEKHRDIFAAMHRLESAGTMIDRVTLFHSLVEAKRADAVGGLTGILELEEGMPRISDSNLTGWIAILREKAALRRIITVSDRVIQRAMAGEASEAILAGADLDLSGISDQQNETEFRSPGEIMAEYPGGWQHMIDPPKGGAVGVHLPWQRLSEDLCGLKPGELVLVGARPGMGKSIFGIQAAHYAAKSGISAAVFSLEMTGEAHIKRLIASEGRVNSHLMRHGQLSHDAKIRARTAVFSLNDIPLYIDQRTHSTFSIRLAVKRLQRRLKKDGKPPLGLVVVDHFHLLDPITPREDPREKFNRSADDLMRLAKEFGLPVMVLCQLSRKCEDEQREPIKSDLAETGKLEQNAHVVVFLHRPEVYPKYREREDLRGVAYAIIAKQREGPIGSHELAFVKEFQKFEQPEERG